MKIKKTSLTHKQRICEDQFMIDVEVCHYKGSKRPETNWNMSVCVRFKEQSGAYGLDAYRPYSASSAGSLIDLHAEIAKDYQVNNFLHEDPYKSDTWDDGYVHHVIDAEDLADFASGKDNYIEGWDGYACYRVSDNLYQIGQFGEYRSYSPMSQVYHCEDPTQAHIVGQALATEVWERICLLVRSLKFEE